MSAKNGFVSVLEAVGRDIEKAVEKVLPIAQEAEPIVQFLSPSLAPLFNTTVGVVSTVEQKFAAMGKQSGTGAQKLAEAVSILAPVAQQFLGTADHGTIAKYISSVVSLLNAVPGAAL